MHTTLQMEPLARLVTLASSQMQTKRVAMLVQLVSTAMMVLHAFSVMLAVGKIATRAAASCVPSVRSRTKPRVPVFFVVQVSIVMAVNV